MSKTADSTAAAIGTEVAVQAIPGVASQEVLASYPVFCTTGDIRAVIAANLEGETLGFSDLDRVKVPSGGATTWKLPTVDGEKKVDEFEGIIAIVKVGRSFWEKEFDGQGTPPDCFSSDNQHGKGTPGGNCDACPNNQYESARNGLGKACKEVRTVFVLMPGTFLPLVINVPPTGLKDFKKYRLRLANAGINVNHVITKFALTEDKNKGGIEFSKVVFSKGDALPASEAARMDAYIESLRPVFERTHAEAMADGSGYAAASEQGSNPYDD